jgi:hypothetical protein
VNESEIRDQVFGQFCEMLKVYPLSGGAFSLATPFMFGDGDGLPIILEPVDGGWQLTDRGSASGHLFFDEEMTEARWDFVRRVADHDGLNMSDQFVLSSDVFDALPSAIDVADFIQSVARIGAVGGIPPRSLDRYITTIRTEVQRWLSPVIERHEHWYDRQHDPHRTYTADLRANSPGGRDVVMFFVATDKKASDSALALTKYHDWKLGVGELVAYRPGLAKPSLRRLQDSVENPDFVIAVPQSEPDYLRNFLPRIGLDLAPA